MDDKHLAWLAAAAAAAALTLSRLAAPGEATAPASSPQGQAPETASAYSTEADGGPAPQAGAGSTRASGSAGPQASVQPPHGLSPEQWQQLQQALADHPQRDAELARIGAYMAYMNTAQRFRELRQQGAGTPPGEQLQGLARTLESGLQEHLDRGEMTAGEALLLRSATQEVLQPDSALRQQALAVWQQGLAAAQAARTPDPRETAFAQQQAALVARWSALPAAQRDPQALETQLESLRQGIFNPPR
ncbi:MAG TPA: hypothetical protein VFL86_16380 [Burkholderiaceae bacterium]|nr:hypothetical protein [Burkholderiaceae bacterium]